MSASKPQHLFQESGIDHIFLYLTTGVLFDISPFQYSPNIKFNLVINQKLINNLLVHAVKTELITNV